MDHPEERIVRRGRREQLADVSVFTRLFFFFGGEQENKINSVIGATTPRLHESLRSITMGTREQGGRWHGATLEIACLASSSSPPPPKKRRRMKTKLYSCTKGQTADQIAKIHGGGSFMVPGSSRNALFALFVVFLTFLLIDVCCSS